jgi:hypothetical protein
MKTQTSAKLFFGFAVVVCALVIAKPFSFAQTSSASAADDTVLKPDHATSLAYFAKMAPVLQHPRCLNCHPKGDYPLQGMNMKPHIMNVVRGPDNQGFVGMKCATCHGDTNNPNSNVPGAPGWGLAHKSMAWVGKSLHEICVAIKDPKKNGNMPLAVLPIHNGQNALVGWAWNPGKGREPAPGTQKEFGENTKKWVETGAACPN